MKKNIFLALAILGMLFQTEPAQAKVIPLNEKVNYLRLTIPQSEATQATISYLSDSFQDQDIDVKDLFAGQWVAIKVFDANDITLPFTQFPVLFSARQEGSLFYIKVSEYRDLDISVDLKILNSNKTLFMDDQMDPEKSLVIRATPNANLTVVTVPANPNDFALPPIAIDETSKDFSVTNTLYLQLVISKN